jgi:hypothetical protein
MDIRVDCHGNIKDTPMDKQIGGTHYKNLKIQPTDFIYENKIPFIEGNIIKYVVRHRSKNGKFDLLKAKHYIEILLEKEYGETK